MRKQINNPTHLKNKILISIYVFRYLSAEYFDRIVKTRKEKQQVYETINYLVKQNFILKKELLHEFSFLYLTKKGYDFVTKNLIGVEGTIPFYQYRTDRSQTGYIFVHNYMNFTYVWNFISNNPELLKQNIQIYEDGNKNQCKLVFYHGGKNVILSPDVLIFTPEKNSIYRKAVIVENDFGGETHATLFKKLIEYSIFIKEGMKQNKIKSVEIYFILVSYERAHNLFGTQGTIAKMADYFNSSYKVKDVDVRDILQVFQNGENKIFYSVFNRRPDITCQNFLPYDFRKEIIALHPSWERLRPQ